MAASSSLTGLAGTTEDTPNDTTHKEPENRRNVCGVPWFFAVFRLVGLGLRRFMAIGFQLRT
ncbi:MAG: hypothetical protein ACLSV7_05295, partial [Oscillospiraceae bacterium]